MHRYSTAETVTIYCLCEDFLKAWGHRDDPQARVTTAEVMTVALLAAARFGGNHRLAALVLRQTGEVPVLLSPGRFSRRLHAIPEAAWQALLALLAGVHCQRNEGGEYAVDSMPVPVCDNIRISRCHLYRLGETGGAFRGYVASKRRYFAFMLLRAARPPGRHGIRSARGVRARPRLGGGHPGLARDGPGSLAGGRDGLGGRGLPGPVLRGSAGGGGGGAPGRGDPLQQPGPAARLAGLPVPAGA